MRGLFIGGVQNSWTAAVFPSVIVILFMVIGYLYGELAVYRKDQGMYYLSEQFYQGKIMARLAEQRLLAEIEGESKGEIHYNIGKVSYRIHNKTVHLDVYVNGELLFTESEKKDTKKSNSLR